MICKYITVLALLFAALGANAAGKVCWLETQHNFGAFHEDDGMAECVFRYVNTGDSILRVTAARTSCGCTLLDYSREPLAPGDTASVTVCYDPTGRPGRFSKKVYIDMNTEPVRTTLTVSGVVIGAPSTVAQRYPVALGPAMRLSRGAIMAGDVAYGRVKSVFLEVYNASSDTLHPAVISAPRFMDVVWMPEAVAPGEQSSLVCRVRSSACGQWGLVADSVVLASSAVDSMRFVLPATVIVSEDFSKLTDAQRSKAPVIEIEPERLDFGLLDRANGTVILDAKIGNRGHDPLVIRRVYTADPGIKVSVSKERVKKGRHADVTVCVDPSLIAGSLLNSKITVISNDPTRPNTTLRIVGEIRQ